MAIKQISVFVENRPGRLAVITDCLAKANVSIRALCVADTTDFGILRLIVSDSDAALKALNDAKVTVSVTEVIAVSIQDVAGALSRAVKVLSDAHINIEYVYAFLTPEVGSAYVIIRVDNNEAACRALADAGVSVVEQDAI